MHSTTLQRMTLMMALLLTLGSTALAQQYSIHAWNNFEDGTLPKNLFLGHDANSEVIKVIPMNSPGIPQEAKVGIASSEIGTHTLLFTPDNVKRRHLSIVSPTMLERSRLGANGRALFQADVFLPAPGEPMAGAALMAVVQTDNKQSYRFYRFGILPGGDRAYFSFTNDKPEPEAGSFRVQNLDKMNLKRPGWHRFQIIFLGQTDIYCAVDGQFTSFSPIKEATLQSLNVGMMVSGSEVQSPVFADNLSIQWSFENLPLPDSPWLQGVRGQRIDEIRQAVAAGSATRGNLYDEEGGLLWHSDPRVAWMAAQAEKKPLLTMFYAPKIEPYNYLKTITPSTNEAANFLNQYVLLKIDANQLAGGKLAQDYRVLRLPTFIVIGSDAKERQRLPVMSQKTTWENVVEELGKATTW